MPNHPILSRDTVRLLAQTLDLHIGPEGNDLALLLCADGITFAQTYAHDGVGARARRSVALLLELGCPEIPVTVRRDIAVACELIAIGDATRPH